MKRASGVLMHVSSLWGEYSSGSFGQAAREWIDFLSDCGFSYWQTLPFSLTDDYHSPYCSPSTFSLNPYFIDLPLLCEQGLLTAEELACAVQQTPYRCEFARLKEERMKLLRKAFVRFRAEKDVDDFLQAHPRTADFCRYMGLRAANRNRPFAEWTEVEECSSETKFWRFLQYVCYQQWMSVKSYANERGIRIIGDVPIYVSLESSDIWASPEQFWLDRENKPVCVAGVPPDYFCADGQRWGNPLYKWDYMEADGFGWWKERIRFMGELFDGVRIDHFRGLESYYAIPSQEPTARNGVWKKGPGMKLIRALKEACPDRLLIAEDLGEITPEVYQLVSESGFPGMRVLQFGFLGDEDSPHLPHNYENHCVAYTGTHDNNTLLGYIWELDEGTRRRVLQYCGYKGEDWDRCYDEILRTMFASHAGLLILPVQDLLLYGRDTRMNTPGTDQNNWSYRLTRDQWLGIDREKFRRWNELYGRKRT